MSQQRKKRDNIFDNFSDIDEYIAAKDVDMDVMDTEEGEMDGEGEIDSMFEHYRFPVDKGQTMLRIDKYLTQHMEKTSRHRIQLAIDAGYVRVDGRIVKANYKVKPNELITIVMPYQRRGMEIRPENIPLDIAYEDDDLLGIIRAVGDGYTVVFIQDILVYPEKQRQGVGTALIKAVLTRYPDVRQIELTTDKTPKTFAFYKSLGFSEFSEMGCCGFIRC